MPCPTKLPDALVALMPQMASLARHLTGNRDQAQDLCQEVLLKLWTRLQEDHDIEDLRAYAMTALRNQYRQWLRDQVPGAELNEVDEPTAPDVFATLAVHELEVAITKLPDPQAQLMQLVASGETSPLSLAKITGLPLGTVMSRLARARAKLRIKVGLGTNAPTADLL
ncbi:RNA polymerase sigma factor [uncultured Roseovarius sp.]|uniref:RNA polymerase sigma factor n=1 Tax=uncultured Roseovarius sp. TaxID=293344 RepID=UPI0026257A56|nr:RNA polymerase sigma factor [uncultured Roseovarius sp.]